MRKEKTPVGDVECPLKGCSERVPVFKYAGSEDAAKRRFAGRLYAICPTHGRIENSEYLLCHAKLKGPKLKGPSAPAEVPAVEESAPPKPAEPSQKPAKSQQPKTPAAEPWWHKLRPIIQ